jgi:hypothetical protein
MSDFQRDPAPDAPGLPEAISFSPGEEAATLDLGADATVVLLLSGAVDRRWAAGAAVELCAQWAAAGRRIVLADMHLENPLLHEVLDVENLEGVVDIFLYGASISRSARPIEGRGFHLITAGTYEVDTRSIYRHPRWTKLVAGFREAGASLVLFAPAAGVDQQAVSGFVERTILLGVPVDGVVPSGLEQGVAGLLVPPGYRLPSREDEDPIRADAEVQEDADLRLPPEPRRAEEPTRQGATIAITLLLLMALLAAVGFGMARYRPDLVPWLTPAGGTPAGTDAVPGRTAAAPGVRRAGETVPFAVLVRSYASLNAAQQQVQTEQRRFADTPFYISPEDDSGVLYFKVYAGLLRDTASAERLRERLLQSGAVDSEDTLGALSLIHRAHLSFDLGEFASRDSAVVVGDSLAAREIPAYAVPMPYEDGSRRWQLYGGAYRDSATADAMRRRLTGAGITPRLVLRVGEPAPGSE